MQGKASKVLGRLKGYMPLGYGDFCNNCFRWASDIDFNDRLFICIRCLRKGDIVRISFEIKDFITGMSRCPKCDSGLHPRTASCFCSEGCLAVFTAKLKSSQE